MPPIKTILKNSLKGATKIALLGIGSELRADDAAGIIVCARLKKIFKQNKKKGKVKVFLGETAPENFTGSINKFNPSHLVLLDAVDMGLKPGQVRMINICKEDAVSFSTHRVPVGVLRDYLAATCGCKTSLVGIQPASIEFCGKVTPAVNKACIQAARQITEALEGFI